MTSKRKTLRDSAPPPAGSVVVRCDPRQDAFGKVLDISEAFVLLHVDGRLSIEEIAMMSGLGYTEVMRAFERLEDAGLVRMECAA